MNLDLQSGLLGGVNVLFKTKEPILELVNINPHTDFQNTFPPEITITIKLESFQKAGLGEEVFRADNWSFYCGPDHIAFQIHLPGSKTGNADYTLLLDPNDTVGDLYYENTPDHLQDKITIFVPPNCLDELLTVQLLAMKRGVLFHACGLEAANNLGLIFAGVSGAGKSTTAKLWQESGKCTLIGDERVAVRKCDNRFWSFSTAWFGSRQIAKMGKMPLNYLFILRHALSNEANLLKPAEAVSLLLTRTFLPFWDRAGMEFTLEFLEDLCSTVPCYHLGFTPDQSAVDYVECLISS